MIDEIWKDVKGYEGLEPFIPNPEKRALKTKVKSIQQKRIDGEVIAAYCSIDLACALLGYDKNTLEEWCRIGIGGGYLWGYDNDERMD